MRPAKRTIRVMLVLALVALASVAIIWRFSHKVPPQIITLANGEQYQFVGVTYSKKLTPPVLAARLAGKLPAKWLPKSVQARYSQFNAGQTFDSPRLILWFRQQVTPNPATPFTTTNLMARLSDESGVEAGVASYPGFASTITWTFVDFPVFPRRSRMIECNFYPFFYSQTPPKPVAHVTFPNPEFGGYPEWKPDPVPSVKMAGDVQVRLDNLAAGQQSNPATVLKTNGSRGPPIGPAPKGRDTITAIDLSLTSTSDTNELWVPQDAELSDATGNVLRAAFTTAIGYIQNGQRLRQRLPATAPCSEMIQGTLWPGEAAWRLKLQVKRAFGFASNEVLAFTNVPVPAMGTTNILNIVKGDGPTRLVLAKFVRRPDIKFGGMDWGRGTYTEISFEFPSNHAGMAFDLQSCTGETNGLGWSRSESGSGYVLALPKLPANAQTIDITWVAQKTRTVEFVVPPPKWP